MTFKYGDSLVVVYKFKGQKEEDLPCQRGEKITVLSTLGDPNWITCVNSKRQQGLVPINHVKLYISPVLDELWFHGEINRFQAEQRLFNSKDGTFLVRSSNKFPGDFSLCVNYNNVVEFYHVLSTKDGYSLDEEISFASMPELITHYQESDDGLCCVLSECCENIQKAQLDYLEEKGLLIHDFELNLGRKIGSGEFCEVFKGKFRDKRVAVKCFQKNNNLAAENLFTLESSLMAKLNHPNLVKFMGMSQNASSIYLITEFMENGSLVHYLQSRGRAVIKTNDQIRFALDSCMGMCYLEEHCLVHRDLAARNILLNDLLVAKVSDFGLAKFDNSKESLCHTCNTDVTSTPSSPSTVCNVINELASLPVYTTDENSSEHNRIPVKWTAPEALAEKKYSNKSDVWSFGILLWEIFAFGRTPYPRISATLVKQKILKGYRMECPDDTPTNIYDIMKMCWETYPDKRPNFAELKSMLKPK